jgi:hypothetical protein
MVAGLKAAEGRVKTFAKTVSSNFKTAFIGGIGGGLVQLAGASIEKLRAAIIQQFADTSRLGIKAKAIVESATRAMVRFGQAVFDSVQVFTVALAPGLERLFNGLTKSLLGARGFIQSIAKDIGRAFEVAVRYTQEILSVFPNKLAPKGGEYRTVTTFVSFILDVGKSILVTINLIIKAGAELAASIVRPLALRQWLLGDASGVELYKILRNIATQGGIVADKLERISSTDIIQSVLDAEANRVSKFVSTLRAKLAADLKRDAERAQALPFLKKLATDQVSGVVGALNSLLAKPAASFGQRVFGGLVQGAKWFNEKIKDRLDSIRSLESGLVGALEAGSMEAVQAQIAVRDPLAGIKQKAEQELLGETQKQTSLLDNISKGVGDLAAKLGIVGISG